MAIVISGVNNNDKITAADGTIDLLSGVNYAGIITAPGFSASGNITAGHINIGSSIQLGNAGVATATTFVGNLTGNVNATSNLLLQIGGSEKFRVGSSGQLGIGGANYGTSGQVLTSGGSGSAATWSTINGTTINNNANNRLITGSGTANTLNAESNVLYDGTNFGIGKSPSRTLDVEGKIRSSEAVCFGNNSSTPSEGSAIHRPADSSLAFVTNNTERARITSGGEFQIQHFSPPDGSSASRAARSALEIKRYYPQKTSGNYWIKDNNGTARQIYCEMETDGGGWMLWHDHNAPGSKVSMNIALGGSDASPSSNLARSNYNNYAYYAVWIRASDIDSTGERLHSFVQLDQDGELKYVADYGADFLLENVGDAYQPDRNEYFASNSTTEYVSNTQMFNQCGASGWQSFSNGGWQEVYIREMDTRISPGDHRSLHLVDRIYGFDSNGVPRWTISESMSPLPFWGDISLFNGEVADGNQNIIQNGQREIRANSGNNGPSSQGRSRGVFTGSFEIEFQLGQLWGWSIGALSSSIQVAANIRANITTPYQHFVNYYSLTTGNSTPYALYSLYNNSSNNHWMPVSQNQFQAYNEQQYSGGNSGSNVIWRTDDGTIYVKCKSGSQSHGPYTFPTKFAGPLIFSSGQQGPHSTFIYDCWNSTNTGSTVGGRNRWYK